MAVQVQVFSWLEPSWSSSGRTCSSGQGAENKSVKLRTHLLKDISGSTTMEPSVSTPSTLKTWKDCSCRKSSHSTMKWSLTSYSGSEAFLGASARHPLNTSSNTGDLRASVSHSTHHPFKSFHLFILRSSLTLTCPSASAELGLGGGELESLRQAPFRVSRLGTAPVMSSSSSPFPLDIRHETIHQKGLTTLALLCWLRFILLTPASRLNLASKDAASPTRDLCSSRWGSPWKPRGLRELDLVLSTGSWADCIGFIEIVCGRQISTCSMA